MQISSNNNQKDIQGKQSSNITLTIKNVNRSIQDLQLQVPASWTFGQLLFIINQNHHQLKNYKLNTMKFMIGGSYVDEDDKISRYVKKFSQELSVFLKVDINATDQSQQIQQTKINLNQTYALNHLWENYIEYLTPFGIIEEEAVKERNLQQQKIELEILSSSFPILNSQTESIIQEKVEVKQEAQRAQPNLQNQINQEVAEDNFYAKNIPIMILIYYFIIQKFDGILYIVLLTILILYFFIKYQDYKYKRQQAQQRQEAQEVANREAQEEQKQNTETQDNASNENDKKDLSTGDKKQGEENKDQNNLNLNNSNQQSDQSSKEINIESSAPTNNNQSNTQSRNNEPPKPKKRISNFVLSLLRLKEFVYCFVMSLFPLWHIELYVRNNPAHEEFVRQRRLQRFEQNQNEAADNQNNPQQEIVINQKEQNPESSEEQQNIELNEPKDNEVEQRQEEKDEDSKKND